AQERTRNHEVSETPTGAAGNGGALYSTLRRVIDVRAPEVPALAWSWLYIFAVLSSYYIMRPIRDQMGVAGGVNNLQWLFTGVLIGMLLLNVPFAYLVKKLPRSRFIPSKASACSVSSRPVRPSAPSSAPASQLRSRVTFRFRCC